MKLFSRANGVLAAPVAAAMLLASASFVMPKYPSKKSDQSPVLQKVGACLTSDGLAIIADPNSPVAKFLMKSNTPMTLERIRALSNVGFCPSIPEIPVSFKVAFRNDL